MTLIIDASVAVKWVLPEIGSDDAAALRRQDPDLVAPSLIVAEIGNALWKKVIRGEIKKREALPAIQMAVAQFRKILPFEDFMTSAFGLAIDLRHPIYDCLYLALAQRENASVATADEDMITAARKAKIKVRRI